MKARFPTVPRVTVLLPPLAPRGPIVEIRRMGPVRSLSALVTKEKLTKDAASLLEQIVDKGRTLMVVGELGAGVTTLLGALGSTIDKAPVCSPSNRPRIWRSKAQQFFSRGTTRSLDAGFAKKRESAR